MKYSRILQTNRLGARLVTFALVFLLVFIDASYLLLNQSLPSTSEAEAAPPGSFSVFRDAGGGQNVPGNGTPVAVTWDTSVSASTGISLQNNGHDIRVDEAGKYLVLYNAWSEATGGTNRRMLDGYISVNGTPSVYGWGSGYIRNAQGNDTAYPAGAAILDLPANANVAINTVRTDSNTSASTALVGGKNGVSVVRLRDDWGYLRVRRSANSADISSNTSFAPVQWNAADEVDTDHFGFTATSDEVTLKGAPDSLFLINTNVYLEAVGGGSTRQNYEMRLTLNGTEVPGSRTTLYLRGSDGTHNGALAYSGVVQKTSSSNQTLRVEVRRESSSGTNTRIVGGKSGLSAVRLPNSTNLVSLRSTGSSQALTNARTPFNWNSQVRVDDSFTHNASTDNSRITLNNSSNYLFFSSTYANSSSGSNRNAPQIEWRVNGSSVQALGGHGGYRRGNQGGDTNYTVGSASGVLYPSLSSGSYIELVHENIMSTTPEVDYEPGFIALQGLELDSLFLTDVTVAAAGSQAGQQIIPATQVYSGGKFAITERTAARNVTNITLTESGSVNAQSGLANIRLYYDLDTTAPYDCSSESFSGSESQFGSTLTGGFSGPNGVASFSGSVGVSPTQSLCLYVVYDVTSQANDGDTVQVSIADPTSDILVTGGGSVGPFTSVAPSGVTSLASAELTQDHYHWRNDDGDEITATSLTGGVEDTTASGFQFGQVRRLRLGVSAQGSTTSPPTQLRLEYAEKAASCSVSTGWTQVGASNADWDVASSGLTDGADTTDIPVSSGGVSNEAGTFIATNTGQRDASSQVSTLFFNPDTFTEVEFALTPTAFASDGTSYCFRLTDAGNPLPNYSVYAEGIVSADVIASVLGEQVSTIGAGSDDAYLGGTFRVQRTGNNRTLESITVDLAGSLDIGTHVTNPRLYYDIDTTSPYDCSNVSFDGTESFWSGTDLSGANSSTTFSGSVTINSFATFCGYVVVDVGGAAPDGEILTVSIDNPSVDVVVNSGTVGPTSPLSPTGESVIAGTQLEQTGYHWRNDDANESGATSATAGVANTPLPDVARETTQRLRLQLKNDSSIDAANAEYTLEYGVRVSTCEAVGLWQSVASTGAFAPAGSSQLTEGADTTNINEVDGGIPDPGGRDFVIANGGQRDETAVAGPVTLTTSNFAEFEFAITPTNEAGFDTTYCFRLSQDGEPLATYTSYAQLTTRPDQDFFVQRGTAMISGTSTTLVAGTDYVQPASATRAFIRITNTSITGAGNDTGGGNQNPNNFMAYIENPEDIMSAVRLARPNSSGSNTFVAWEIVEFTGVSGSDNEMIVRDVGTVTYGTSDTTASGPVVSGIGNDNDVAVFITGQYSPATNRNTMFASQSTSRWNASQDRPEFERGAAGDVATQVSYAVIEYTGINWAVQRVSHTYTSAGTTETEAITAVNSLSRTFLHTQKRLGSGLNSLNQYGHQVWLSSIGLVSFRLEGSSGQPEAQTSVAWVIENKQSGSGAMRVYRSNGTLSGGDSPQFNEIGIGSSVEVGNASLFVNTDSSGGGDAFPRPILGAHISSSTDYILFKSDSGQTQSYRAEVVEWPVAEVAVRQNYYRFYVDNDALTPTDPWPPGGTNLGENMSISELDSPLGVGDRVRIRMSLNINNATLPQGAESYKLQYARRITTCGAVSGSNWNDLGNPGSGSVWRGYNSSVANGTAISSNNLLLSVSDVGGRFQEQNPTAVNPVSVSVGQDIEYDWLIEQNGALQRNDYCFRMVRSDGTTLENYFYYPTIRTSGYTPVISQWRWYGDAENVTPLSPLANENDTPIDIQNQSVIKLRTTVAEVAGASGNNVKFALAYSQSANFSDGGTILTEQSSCELDSLWCFADGGGVDNEFIAEAILSDAESCVDGLGSGCGTHNESASGVSPINHAPNSIIELEFTIRHAGARSNGVYYFRLIDTGTEDAVVASTTYPSLVTEGAQLEFTVAGVGSGTSTAGIVTDVATTPTSVSFSSLPLSTSQFAAHRLTVDSNATEGHAVLMYSTSQLVNSQGDTIPPITSTNAEPAGWNTACNLSTQTGCFGYHTTDAVLANGSTRFAPTDSYAAFSTSPQEVMYSAVPTSETHDIVYQVAIGELQAAGDYESDVFFLAIPVF